MKNHKLLTRIMSVIMCLICMFSAAASTVQAAKVTDLDTGDFLKESNWKNLPGYEYVMDGVKDEAGKKYPAQVTFGKDASGVGINMKVRGYYQPLSGDSAGNQYAGLVFQQKVPVDGFSITLTINKLGASSSASPADDGWIGIGLMSKANLWHTANTDVNSGAVALLRMTTMSALLPLRRWMITPSRTITMP